MFTIKKIDVEPEIDPYHRDTNQISLTCLLIDPEARTLEIYQGYDSNSTTMRAYNGMDIDRTVPLNDGYLSRKKIKHFLSENENLVNAVIDGWSCDWNGSNHVGNLNDEAISALNELISGLSFCGGMEWYTAEEYLQSAIYDLTDKNTDEICKIAQQLYDDCDDNIIGGYGAIENRLLTERDYL